MDPPPESPGGSLENAPLRTLRPNQIWGEDWTLLNIAGIRHYLLTIIDYFSRYIVARGIVPSVTHREVQDLLTLAYMSQGMEGQDRKPLLRTDRGSPNLEGGTKRLIRDLEMILSPGRADRPTDNARQERWYRTVKQEEIYLYPTYPSLEIARASLAGYIDSYNILLPQKLKPPLRHVWYHPETKEVAHDSGECPCTALDRQEAVSPHPEHPQGGNHYFFTSSWKKRLIPFRLRDPSTTVQ